MKYLACCLLLCPVAFAQLTPEQKLADFNQLASMYAKHYAPYEWKRDTLQFDLYKIQPWLDRVAASRTDLDFYEVCIEYVASLNDGHDYYSLPTDFSASLGFRADLFDNLPLVYSVNRGQLPASQFPIAVGDELLSIDGVSAEDLIRQHAKYAVAANDRSTARLATLYLTVRPQSVIPHAVDLPEESVVVVRSADGETKTLRIPWVRTGTPLRSVGPVPSPKGAMQRSSVGMTGYLNADDPAYMLPLRMLSNLRAPKRPDAMVAGFGALTPVHRMPSGFVQRLGRSASDAFFSGTYTAGGKRIGFIRIPHFDPPSQAFAYNQFATEIQYFQGNVDGLVVDVTRNYGGDGCYAEALISTLIPVKFRGVGFEIRATNFFVQIFSEAVEQAKAFGAPDDLIEEYESILQQIRKANSESRGKTGVLPICSTSLDVDPATDSRGRSIAYNKPVILLTDDLSASAADMFAAVFQDSWRGPIFGWRTMGLGGSVGSFNDATTYSEGTIGITWTQLSRPNRVSHLGYPSTNYIENVGIHPDIRYDSQTRENLMNGYMPYVEAFTNAMLDHIQASQ